MATSTIVKEQFAVTMEMPDGVTAEEMTVFIRSMVHDSWVEYNEREIQSLTVEHKATITTTKVDID